MSLSSSPQGARRLRLAAVALAVVAVAGVGRYSWLSHAQAAAPKAVTAVPVHMSQATQMDVPVWLSAIGNVQPLNSVNVRVRADGELTQVLFNEGQMVTAGSLLAQIDPRTYQAQVAQAQAAVARDQAQLANLHINLQRATNLAAAKAGPTQDVDTYKAQMAAQQATVQADQAALDNARLQLGFTQVRAPFTGRTGQRQADVGSIVHAAEATGLVTLTQMDPITVAFAVSQDDLAQILEQNAKTPLEVIAVSRDGSHEIARGKLTFIDSQVAVASGQVQLKAQFDNGKRQLWPGELVSARLLINTQQDATVVPASAVQLGRDGDYVYVVNARQEVEARQVKTSPIVIDGKQWIRSGLNPGETVVTVGQSRVAPGVKVSAAKTEAVATATGGVQ